MNRPPFRARTPSPMAARPKITGRNGSSGAPPPPVCGSTLTPWVAAAPVELAGAAALTLPETRALLDAARVPAVLTEPSTRGAWAADAWVAALVDAATVGAAAPLLAVT